MFDVLIAMKSVLSQALQIAWLLIGKTLPHVPDWHQQKYSCQVLPGSVLGILDPALLESRNIEFQNCTLLYFDVRVFFVDVWWIRIHHVPSLGILS